MIGRPPIRKSGEGSTPNARKLEVDGPPTLITATDLKAIAAHRRRGRDESAFEVRFDVRQLKMHDVRT